MQFGLSRDSPRQCSGTAYLFSVAFHTIRAAFWLTIAFGPKDYLFMGSFTTVWQTGIACPGVRTHRVLSGVRWQSAQPERPRPCPREQAKHCLQVFEYLTGVAQVHLWSGIPFESPTKQLLHITTIATVRDLEWHEGVEGCAVWSPRVRRGTIVPTKASNAAVF